MQNLIKNNEWETAIYNLLYESRGNKTQLAVDLVHEYIDKKDKEIKDLKNLILALEYKIESLENPEQFAKDNSRLKNRGIN